MRIFAADYQMKGNNAMTTMTIHYDAGNKDAQSLADFIRSVSYMIVDETPSYDPEYVTMIKESKEEARQGKVKTVKTEDLWK